MRGSISLRLDSLAVTLPNGCWHWIGKMNHAGYGSFYFKPGKTAPAHRAAYETWKGPIPPGLTIDHLCRNRACINPDHLEAVTYRENIMRGETAAALNVRKTHCPHGHEYTPENTWVYKNRRHCRTCARLHGRDTYQRLYANPDYKPRRKKYKILPEDRVWA